MPENRIDFLDAIDREYSSRDDFIDYIQTDVDLNNLDNKLSVVGSVSEYTRSNFIQSLQGHFNIVDEQEELILLWAENESVPYYVSLHDREFPLFFTAANKTDEIPDTLVKYLKSDQMMSRMWVGKREMERLREQMVRDYDHLLIPYFTAKRSKHTDIPAEKRPDYDRTMSYWADDGLETFRHMKSRYGVLPTNLQFQQPGSFKFQITQDGVFTAIDNGVEQISNLIQHTINRLRIIKSAIDTADYNEKSYDILQEFSFPYSKPWAIQLDERPAVDDIRHFEGNLAESNLEFDVLDFDPNYEKRAFDAELADTEDYSRTGVRTKEDQIRVYPRESTGIDQSFRIYNFIDDHISPNPEAIEVV